MAERGRSLEGGVLNPILQKFPCQETVLQVSSLKSSFWQLFYLQLLVLLFTNEVVTLPLQNIRYC